MKFVNSFLGLVRLLFVLVVFYTIVGGALRFMSHLKWYWLIVLSFFFIVVVTAGIKIIVGMIGEITNNIKLDSILVIVFNSFAFSGIMYITWSLINNNTGTIFQGVVVSILYSIILLAIIIYTLFEWSNKNG